MSNYEDFALMTYLIVSFFHEKTLVESSFIACLSGDSWKYVPSWRRISPLLYCQKLHNSKDLMKRYARFHKVLANDNPLG